jgi:hypothetical protein
MIVNNNILESKYNITQMENEVDQLPKDILSSTLFTKNDLGQLAGIEELPNETDVNEYKLLELSDLFVTLDNDAEKLEKELHARALSFLKQNKLQEAWLTLLAFNNG